MVRIPLATLRALALILVLLSAWPTRSQTASDPNVAPGLVLVKLSPEALPSITQRIQPADLRTPQVRQVLQAAGATWGEKVFRDFFPADTLATHRATGEPVTLIDLSRWYTLHVPEHADVTALARRLREVPGIEAASPAFIMTAASTLPESPLPVLPNDELFEDGRQWGLRNLQNPGRDLHTTQAWERNTGRSDVVVAVIDTGVDYNHPDLDPGNRSRVIAGFDVDSGGDPMDDGYFAEAGHGTAVAGVLGAITDNDLKAAGVMWDLKIMPVKVFTDSGVLLNSYVAQGIEYARVNGADIANISLEVPGPNWWETEVMADASINAYRAGVAFFTSMGNDGTSEPQYPAGFPWVMAVGATNRSDQRVQTSNTGSHIDVVAPGDDHWSLARYNGIRSFGGTSCASPLAAGVAGLVLSESRDLGLGLTNDDLYWVLRHSADDVNGGGFDVAYGYGRVNAERALALVNAPNTVSRFARTGGGSTMTQGSHTRNFLGGHYGLGQYLAAGAYHGVKQYRVSGHFTFSSPYQQSPLVWVRDGEVKGYSNASPNTQAPWVRIYNVTATGFDYETYVYWIGYDTLGREINTYVPASPSQAATAFTVVGEYPPLTSVSISGPSSLPSGTTGAWGAHPNGGAPPYTYAWTYRPACSGGGGAERQRPGDGSDSTSAGDLQSKESAEGTASAAFGLPVCGAWENGGSGQGMIRSFIAMGTVMIRVTVTDANATTKTATTSVTITSSLDGEGGEEAAVASSTSETPAIEASADEAPVFVLDAARPNPFATATALRFALPSASEVRLAVFDALGRAVARLVDGPLVAGRHEVVFDGAALPAGVYVVRLTAADAAGVHTASTRVTLLR